MRALARRSLGEPPASYLEDFRRAAKIEPIYRRLYEGALRGAEGKAAGGAVSAEGERRPVAGSSLTVFLRRPPPA